MKLYKVVRKEWGRFYSFWAGEISPIFKVKYTVGKVSYGVQGTPLILSTTLDEAVKILEANKGYATNTLECEGEPGVFNWGFISKETFQDTTIEKLKERFSKGVEWYEKVLLLNKYSVMCESVKVIRKVK
jgi:hypothetical protein